MSSGDGDEDRPDLSPDAVNQRLSAFVSEHRAALAKGDPRARRECDMLLAAWAEETLAYQEKAAIEARRGARAPDARAARRAATVIRTPKRRIVMRVRADLPLAPRPSRGPPPASADAGGQRPGRRADRQAKARRERTRTATMSNQVWLGTYAFDADHTTVATLADPAAIAAMQPTIERGYAADATSRQAFLRNAAREAADSERERARETLRRQHLGVDARWFWRFVNEVLEDWRAEANEARLERDFPRAAQIDNRVDGLCKDLERVERLQVLWERRR